MNKNIDDIFKNKLKEFKATPSPEVWENIVSNLPQKKKRRVLPMWWFGAAASVALLAFIFFPNSSNRDEDLPLEKEIIIVSSPEEKNKKENLIPLKKKENIIVSPDENHQKETIAITTKKKVKNTSKKVVKKKDLSDLVDAKIAMKKVKPVVKNAMKKILTKKDGNKVIANKSPKTKVKPKKDLIAKTVDDKKTVLPKKKKEKWSLTPVVAVLSSNSFSKNSPLDETLVGNSTKGTNSFSYGIKVAYQINKKWSIQSGIHLQKTDYINNNLSIISNVSGSSLAGLESNASFSLGSQAPRNNQAFLSGAKIISSTATLTQSFGYIEIPVEIKYTFLESNKFNSKIVTGFSSLFLNDNSVFVDSEVLSEKVGKANNLNSVNFSGNLGLDLDYAINNNFKLNFNPMFKVQLNTFSKNSNGFKPFIIGFYSGIKYQF